MPWCICHAICGCMAGNLTKVADLLMVTMGEEKELLCMYRKGSLLLAFYSGVRTLKYVLLPVQIESPGQCSNEDVIMQQLAKHFPPIPPSLEIGEKLPFTLYTTFSTVYSGTLDGEPVMVKTITHLAFEPNSEVEEPETVVSTFAEELRTLQALNHPQILLLKEAFHDKATKQLIVVMEKAKESVGLYLKAGQGETSYQRQVQICSELICGLLFLYGRNPPIVHGNLNDVNVMMTEEGIVKIDIVDSVLKCNPVNMPHLLPEGLQYLPPEAFTHCHTAEEETDVFSLGVLLLQIATQKAPCVEHEGVGLTPEAERRSDDLGELDDQHSLKPIILQCLQHFPRDRPKVALLFSQVQSLIDSEEVGFADHYLPMYVWLSMFRFY